ncbi:MAG TPA: hypothetical protein VMG08_03635 [Allosphingosinicella sp.]|nr:hypothetical protein [Allosphingosinicella sp.]
MLRQLSIGTAILLGAGALANGTYMLVDPANWYFSIPGVTNTGPFNQHFLRDIGLIFLLVGVAFLWGAAKPRDRAVAWGASALWLSGHALFHVWEVAVGLCAPSDLVRDFPVVSLPAILAACMTWWAIADGRARSTQGEVQ